MDEGAGGKCDQAITSSERRTLRLEAYSSELQQLLELLFVEGHGVSFCCAFPVTQG